VLVGVATLAVGIAYVLVPLGALAEMAPLVPLVSPWGPGCEARDRLFVLALLVETAGAILAVGVGRQRGATAGLGAAVALLSVAAAVLALGHAWLRHAHLFCSPFPPSGYTW
jgi:hypothetical protein